MVQCLVLSKCSIISAVILSVGIIGSNRSLEILRESGSTLQNGGFNLFGSYPMPQSVKVFHK
jgi:hypothetical protein